MKNRIALKLLAYFAVALATFALLSGALFQSLFYRHTVDAKRAEMLTRATTLAQALSDVLGNSASTGRMMNGQGANGGYGAYVRMLSLIEKNVWVLDENLQFLSAGHTMGVMLQYSDLPADAGTLVRQVFAGQTPFSEGFSSLLGAPTLTVGAPIMLGSKVAGALLLHDAVSGIEAASAQGVRLLLYSGAAALLVSILFAAFLSGAFAKPLDRMKATALRLAEGDYAAQTGVHQRDEIGKLAKALDVLSVRLQEAKQASERQEQLRNDFLANVAHELRTPVTVLRGSLEALCDGVITNPTQADEYHHQMLAETLGLQRLVNDLMDMARLQNVDFPMESTAISMNDTLSDALRSAGQIARTKEIRLIKVFPPQAVPFQGDYGRLRQMFLIVLDNAVKYSPANTAVTVTLSPTGVSVQDEGPGIAPEELPLLFDRFRRARATAHREGSGLGLAIAQQIAQRHGIRMSVASKPACGSTFRFDWDVPPSAVGKPNPGGTQ